MIKESYLNSTSVAVLSKSEMELIFWWATRKPRGD